MFQRSTQRGGSGIGKGRGRPLWDGDDPLEDDDTEMSAPPPKRRFLGLGDDDDADHHLNRMSNAGQTADGPESRMGGSAAPAVNDEEDELDAFMAGINAEIKHQETAPTAPKPRAAPEELQEEDHMESYVKLMKNRGVVIGKSGPADVHREVDSDEEVYATARAVDAAMGELDEGGDLQGDVRRRDIEPLAAVDHSKIEYQEIAKDFYEEHPDIAALTEADAVKIRAQLDMRVRGADVAKPCISFAHFGFDEALINVIRKHGYTEPTGIQRQAVPVALGGRDIIGIAKTGSGKTAAFIWPMLVHMMDQEELVKGDGPIGLILAPTRELAHQIYIEAKKFAKAYSLKVSVVYGGAPKGDQFKELRAGGVEILVATPGRLIDLVKMKATNLHRVSYLVLDEADRMFDLGFEPQVRSICNSVRPDRQTLLFSATFKKHIERLASDILTDPVRISIGAAGTANADITQVVQVLPDDGYKWNWLTTRIVQFSVNGAVLIFIGRKTGVDQLAESLNDAGFHCRPLHGDMPQHERDAVVRDYKAGKFKILVSTDVAARGLDIKSIKTVVNYDVAKDIDSHIHRIGRTGRAGEKGTAYTLVAATEDRFAAELVTNLQDANQPIPEDLLTVALKNPRFKKSRDRGAGGGFKGRGRGRGRGGRGGGRGGGAFSGGSNPNMAPLGRGGIGHAPSPPSSNYPNNRRVPPPSQHAPPPPRHFMAFQRAASSQGSSTSFIGTHHQQSSTHAPPRQSPAQNHQSPPPHPERKRRWDA
ncbi:P-loop containing nucleoside triphosphate hydrolase protein [Powellomyces hirtus]|nr:P-loop containing nucleoside triphosphate hydrolase protein [Powellomyces hirtus]